MRALCTMTSLDTPSSWMHECPPARPPRSPARPPAHTQGHITQEMAIASEHQKQETDRNPHALVAALDALCMGDAGQLSSLLQSHSWILSEITYADGKSAAQDRLNKGWSHRMAVEVPAILIASLERRLLQGNVGDTMFEIASKSGRSNLLRDQLRPTSTDRAEFVHEFAPYPPLTRHQPFFTLRRCDAHARAQEGRQRTK